MKNANMVLSKPDILDDTVFEDGCFSSKMLKKAVIRLNDIILALKKFRDKRNWKQFHTPSNLAKSVVIEAGELLQNYQWEEGKEDVDNVKEEIADIVGYCLLLCDYYGFDLETILKEKIAKNDEKYPADKAYGKADKYDKL